MRRREFFKGIAGAYAAGKNFDLETCCTSSSVNRTSGEDELLHSVGSRTKVTQIKAIGVSLTPNSDRPSVFVKLETDAGLVGWGEATLEGKAGSVIAAVDDFRNFIIGADPMAVEHIWQDLYIHSYYRAGPVIGSAISGIDQALWDIRGKMLGLPVWKLLGGSPIPGVRGYCHLDVGLEEHLEPAEIREQIAHASQVVNRQGITAIKSGLPEYYEWIDTRAKIRGTVNYLQMIREGLGPNIEIAIDFHAKTSPAVACVLIKEIEPLNLLWVEEPCPPENVRAMARITSRSAIPIATGERLVASYSCREIVEAGVVDILQPDINHTGGISALWKIAGMADAAGIAMAPHTCEGPIGGIATLHVDAAIPNFLIQEVCSGPEPGPQFKVWEEWFGFPAMRMGQGRIPLPDKPGLGFDLDERVLQKFPFRGNETDAESFF